MSAPPTLHGFELVTHLFVVTTGEADADRERASELWTGYRERFREERPLATHPLELEAGSLPGPGGLLAAAADAGPGMHQALLRREEEIIWLSTVRAPTDGDVRTWPELEADWCAFDPPGADAVIGSVRVLQAHTDRSDDALDPAELADAVRAATGSGGDWADGGIRWTDARLGAFAIWEAPPPGPAPADPDGRPRRRIVVVAPDGRNRELSAWTWTRGPEPTPLGRYFLQAATVRREYRLRPRGDEGTALLRTADRRSDRVLALVRDAAGRAPGSDDLDRASVALGELSSSEPDLVARATWLRESRRNVSIAGRNMTLHLGSTAAVPFEDDRRLADWLERQLENDATYVDTAVDRVRSVARLGDQVVQRGLQNARERLQDRREVLQRRQERFNLALTGLVGAILMALAAIQALSYQPPLPKAAVPATVALLGAFALLMSMIVVRISTAARAAGWALLAAAGLLGAAAGWLVQSWIREGPVGVTWAAAGVGAAVALTVEQVRRFRAGT